MLTYIKIKLTDFPLWFKKFQRNPRAINLNLTGDADKLIVGLSENNDSINKMNLTNEYVVVPIGHCGGTIIGFPNSITLFSFTNRNNPPSWEQDLLEFLHNQGLNAEKKDNDILINNKKIAGSMNKWITPEIQWYGIHISIYADSEKIAQICEKPMLKEPIGLSMYGITREDILNALSVQEQIM